MYLRLGNFNLAIQRLEECLALPFDLQPPFSIPEDRYGDREDIKEDFETLQQEVQAEMKRKENEEKERRKAEEKRNKDKALKAKKLLRLNFFEVCTD
jgi:hypothetical protein